MFQRAKNALKKEPVNAEIVQMPVSLFDAKTRSAKSGKKQTRPNRHIAKSDAQSHKNRLSPDGFIGEEEASERRLPFQPIYDFAIF
jgi:hypothetical protein